jgi:hypothetical protein
MARINTLNSFVDELESYRRYSFFCRYEGLLLAEARTETSVSDKFKINVQLQNLRNEVLETNPGRDSDLLLKSSILDLIRRISDDLKRRISLGDEEGCTQCRHLKERAAQLIVDGDNEWRALQDKYGLGDRLQYTVPNGGIGAEHTECSVDVVSNYPAYMALHYSHS